jgi:hypothetical protein
MNGIPPIVPGTITDIYRNGLLKPVYLQVILAKVMEKDKEGEPRWKYMAHSIPCA